MLCLQLCELPSDYYVVSYLIVINRVKGLAEEYACFFFKLFKTYLIDYEKFVSDY